MVWKRKSGVENGEPPRKRGRPRKDANAVEVKEDGTAAAPLEIQEVSGRRRGSVTILVCSGLKLLHGLYRMWGEVSLARSDPNTRQQMSLFGK